jgi:hypothetical protein
MAETSTETIRRCDCYRSSEVRRLFGWTNERGEPVPVSYTTLQRWRTIGRVPFVKVGRQSFLYPKAKIDLLVNIEIKTTH